VIALIGDHANDAVGTAFNRFVVARLQARRVFTLHAKRRQKISFNGGEFAVFPVINFSAKPCEGHVVFDFAGDGAGVASNAALNV
jgi:hypothetical protein